MVLGIRGLPNVQGGVETHAQQLYPRLAALGCEVTALVRTPFVARGVTSFGPIRIVRLWSPHRAGMEALVHSLLGVLYAAFARPDVLHIHSIGPAVVTPLARLFGLRVVVTFHSQNYNHEKWGGLARWTLRAGERSGARWSQACIAVSGSLVEMIQVKYRRRAHLIPNGVVPAVFSTDTSELKHFGLQPGRYLLHVGRVSSEKRQLDLISAFAAAATDGWNLVLVGAVETDSYARQVRQAAAQAGVIMAGFQKGEPLAQLFTHAGGFVLPSSNEGLPIALLEALSYRLPVLVSDIPANLELDLEPNSYFPMGNVSKLSAALRWLMQTPRDVARGEERRRAVTTKFDWDAVATATLNIYKSLQTHERPQ
jgi:glycosyltransferase involved in cell wall biosynthesis